MTTTQKSHSLPTRSWKGTFAEHLARVKELPALEESAHERLYRIVEREGIDPDRTKLAQKLYGNDKLEALNAFSKFYGIEVPVHQVHAEYLRPAAAGGEASKQALVLIGPPGAGKSDWTNEVKALLQRAEPAPTLKGCPQHDHPISLLYLIPTLVDHKADAQDELDYNDAVLQFTVEIFNDLNLGELLDRKVVQSFLARKGISNELPMLEAIAGLNPDDMVSVIAFGLGLTKASRAVVGAPCPHCQASALGLFGFEELGIAEFPVHTYRFTTDNQGSNSIVDVPEVQPLNFDIAAWIGSEDLAVMGKYTAPDPRCVSLNGAFNKGNRGLVVLTEGLKNPPEAQRILLEALQGRRLGLPSPLTGSVVFDGVIFINSNEGEYTKFMSDKVNEPYADRFYRIYFRYPLEASKITMVDQKLWNSSSFSAAVEDGGVHVEPLVWSVLSTLQALTRIEDPQNGTPLLVKVDAYDGKDARAKGGGTKVSVQDLRGMASWREGLEGMSPREVAKILNAVAGEVVTNDKCVTSKAVISRLRSWFKENVQDEKKREQLTGFLAKEIDARRRQEAQRIVLKSLIEGFGDECQTVWEKYLDNVRAYQQGKAVRSRSGYATGNVGGDTAFMTAIESDPNWGVTSAQADKFRGEIQSAVNEYLIENPGAKKVPYTCHESIKRCIERFVLKQVRQSARLFSTASARTKEDSVRVADACSRLITREGFCEHCSDELLLEASENQDFLSEA